MRSSSSRSRKYEPPGGDSHNVSPQPRIHLALFSLSRQPTGKPRLMIRGGSWTGGGQASPQPPFRGGEGNGKVMGLLEWFLVLVYFLVVYGILWLSAHRCLFPTSLYNLRAVGLQECQVDPSGVPRNRLCRQHFKAQVKDAPERHQHFTRDCMTYSYFCLPEAS